MTGKNLDHWNLNCLTSYKIGKHRCPAADNLFSELRPKSLNRLPSKQSQPHLNWESLASQPETKQLDLAISAVLLFNVLHHHINDPF